MGAAAESVRRPPSRPPDGRRRPALDNGHAWADRTHIGGIAQRHRRVAGMAGRRPDAWRPDRRPVWATADGGRRWNRGARVRAGWGGSLQFLDGSHGWLTLKRRGRRRVDRDAGADDERRRPSLAAADADIRTAGCHHPRRTPVRMRQGDDVVRDASARVCRRLLPRRPAVPLRERGRRPHLAPPCAARPLRELRVRGRDARVLLSDRRILSSPQARRAGASTPT